MIDEYGLTILVEANYGGENNRFRYIVEREDANIDIHEWLDMLRNITVSMGYSENVWKKGITQMAKEYEPKRTLKPMATGPFKINSLYEPFKNTAYLEENDC